MAQFAGLETVMAGKAGAHYHNHRDPTVTVTLASHLSPITN